MTEWSKQTSRQRRRREVPCVSRNLKRPTMAYVMLPRGMAKGDRVSIYHNENGRIAFEFRPDGDFVVRPTSPHSSTDKIVLPASLAWIVPFGLHDFIPEETPEGWLVLDLQRLA